jgi:hypothetical protein
MLKEGKLFLLNIVHSFFDQSQIFQRLLIFETWDNSIENSQIVVC